MTTEEMKNRLHGVLGFLATPFREDLTLDLAGLEHNVDAVVQHPLCAVVPAGGMGEIFSLTPEEIVEVVETTVHAVRSRMPVIAGVAFNVPIATELARHFERIGADGILVFPPYYIDAPADGLLDYYVAIGKASSLPLIVYNRDWVVLLPDLVVQLVERIPTLAGWKDGQRNTAEYQRIMTRVGDRIAWLGGVGDDWAPAYYEIGVQAFTSSVSNIAPKLSLAIADAGMRKDTTRMKELLERYIEPLYAIRRRKRGYEIAVVKQAMEILGMSAGPVRPPLVGCSATEIVEIRRVMNMYGEGGFALSEEAARAAVKPASGE